MTINDIGHVYEILCNWPESDVKVLLLLLLLVLLSLSVMALLSGVYCCVYLISYT